MSTYREQGEAAKKKNEEETLAQADTEKEEVDTQIDQLISKAETNAAEQQKTVESNYRDMIDTVAVQRELDRRQISEAMANMGLTKSGLNATQQTAVQLSAGNKTAAAQRQRQAAVDALTQSLEEYKRGVENNRRESINAIDSAAQKSIAEYNAEVDKNVAAAETAEIEANAKLVEAKNKALSSTMSSNASTLLTMAKNGAIGWDTYAYAVDNGLTASQAVALQSSGFVDGTSNDEPKDILTGSTSFLNNYYMALADSTNYGKGFLGINWHGAIDDDQMVTYYNAQTQKFDTITLKELLGELQKENPNMTKSDLKQLLSNFNNGGNPNSTGVTNDSAFLKLNNYEEAADGLYNKAYTVYTQGTAKDYSELKNAAKDWIDNKISTNDMKVLLKVSGKNDTSIIEDVIYENLNLLTNDKVRELLDKFDIATLKYAETRAKARSEGRSPEEIEQFVKAEKMMDQITG